MAELLVSTPLLSLRQLERTLGYNRRDLRRLADTAGSFYVPFTKIQGEKHRLIDNPTGELKNLQRVIQKRLLRTVPLPPLMFGGIRGRSIVDNARCHLAQPDVVSYDLRDCYPSIDNQQIIDVFVRRLGCSTSIAELLTRITTFNRHLPQGAPTSPMLCNLALLPLFEQLQDLAGRHGLICTFYVDDIVMSGPNARALKTDVIGAIRAAGFRPSYRKLSSRYRSQRQTVTGLTVNSGHVTPGLSRLRVVSDASHSPPLRLSRVAEVRQAIFEFSQRPSMARIERRALFSKIAFIQSVTPHIGDNLAALANKRLPPVIDDLLG